MTWLPEEIKGEEWQSVRRSLLGKWKSDGCWCILQLIHYLGGPPEKAPMYKLLIVRNYLTGSAFRIGIISGPEIDCLLAEVRNEIQKRRKESGIHPR